MRDNSFGVAVFSGCVVAAALVFGGATWHLYQENQRLKAELEMFRRVTPILEEQSKRNACVNQLKMLDGAIQQWALEDRKDTASTVDATAIEKYLPQGFPVCPAGGHYKLTTISALPTCSAAGHQIP